MYGVRFVDDEALPPAHDFVMVRTDVDTMFFVKRTRVTPRVLEQAWAAYRALPGVSDELRQTTPHPPARVAV